MGAVEFEARPPAWRAPVAVVSAAAALLAAVALLWIAGELHYRGCVDHAAAEYPTVPVSAYVLRNRNNVGPLKVSFSQQRAQAANACHRF